MMIKANALRTRDLTEWSSKTPRRAACSLSFSAAFTWLVVVVDVMLQQPSSYFQYQRKTEKGEGSSFGGKEGERESHLLNGLLSAGLTQQVESDWI